MSTMDMGTRYSIWTSAHNAYVNGQYAKALKIYSTLQNLPQVLFNIASILIKMGKYNKAINYLSKAVTKEENFAIAYFQRGFCFFSIQKYETAIMDFSTAEKLLNAHSINYLSAGLNTKLYMCEILYNIAQCYLQLDITEKVELYLANAAKFVVSDSQASVIEKPNKHIYSVQEGLQFIPELKLQTLGPSPVVTSAVRRQPQKSQIQQHPGSSSLIIMNNKPATKTKVKQSPKYQASKSFVLDHLASPNHQIPSSSPVISTERQISTKRKNSIFKIQSPEGNVLISLAQNSTLQDLKQKVAFKLSQIGFPHDRGLSLLKDGIILKTNDEFLHLLRKDEIVHLKVV